MEEQIVKTLDRVLRNYGMGLVSYGYVLGFLGGIVSAREGSLIYKIYAEKSHVLEVLKYAHNQADIELYENGISPGAQQ